MLSNYRSVFERCRPFVIARPEFAASFPSQVMGADVSDWVHINPQRAAYADFMGLLRRLDTLCFGPNGMPMPSWVFYDCAVMPGLFFGFGVEAATLEPWCREAMKVPQGYDGLVPVSQFIAIPTLEGFTESDNVRPDAWLMYSAESINQVSPGFAPAGILRLTLAMGLQLLPLVSLLGTTQWRSHKLSTYVELGPLTLMTAYTPAHTIPTTLSFRINRAEMGLSALLSAPTKAPSAPPPNAWVDPDDVQALKSLQRAIESGETVQLVGAPTYYGSEIRVPLRRSGGTT